MADGSERRIERVRPGDEVLATDPKTGKTSVREVLVVVSSNGAQHLFRIRLANGEELRATPGHPFWVEGRGWIDTARLRPGDVLRELDGSEVAVVEVRAVRVRRAAVYNLVVAGDHTYHVGLVHVLVHNGCLDVWSKITPTDDVYKGTVVPRSFNLATDGGLDVHVVPNATKHIVERIRRQASVPLQKIAAQTQLASLQAAVSAATRSGIRYNRVLRVGGWELIFAPPRTQGQLPVLKHALYRG